jgi:hypothetical protein
MNRRLGGARVVSGVLAAWLVAGCSALGLGPGSGAAGAGGVTPPTLTQAPVNAPDGKKPSGAKVRVINAYAPVTGDPSSIDVYVTFDPKAGDKPLLSVPYGTMTDFFDPTVSDDQGDGVLAFFPAGVVGQGKDLITQQKTFTSGEALTIYVTTGDKKDDGSYGGSTIVFEHHPADAGAMATPDAGKGLLYVVSSGLDNVFTSAPAESWYVGYGSGCEPGLGNTKGNGITTTVDPGQTGAGFDIEPGSQTVSIYASPNDQAGTCTGTPIVTQPVTAKAGETDVLFLFAPKDKDLHSLLVPLEP